MHVTNLDKNQLRIAHDREKNREKILYLFITHVVEFEHKIGNKKYAITIFGKSV